MFSIIAKMYTALLKIVILLLLTCGICVFSNVQAWDYEHTRSTEIAKEKSKIIEQALIDFSLKHDVPTSHIVRAIEKFMKIKELSQPNKYSLKMTIAKLKNHKAEFILPQHWELSSKANVMTYRLHHFYREEYLKYKSEYLIGSYVFKKNVWEKIVYLTFDDGPYNTQKPVLDYMIDEKIPGTFFLICSKLNEANLSAYKKDFFTIGMHTNHHQNYDHMTKDQILNDIDGCNTTFDRFKLEKKIFRPAFGIVNLNQSKVLALNNIDGVSWSMDSLDWEWVFHEQRIEEMLEAVSWWEIILLHENVDLEMFTKLVEWLREKGYSFGKL